MKTPTAKKRLIEIVDKLLDETLIEPNIVLSYCDPFNRYADLDIEIAVSLSFYTQGYDENEQTFFDCSSVNVTKFNMLDAGGDRVLNIEQEKELIRMISQHISDYYDNKGKRHI
jgi:hypothetical protein